MTKYQRHVSVQALIVVSGWFSLCYGWGLEVQRWPVLIAWGGLLSTTLCFGNVWVMRGKDTANKVLSEPEQ